MFYKIRNELHSVQEALDKGQLSIGFLGGSITEQSAQHNWADQLTVMLKDEYSDVRIRTQNLAIGATTSMLGVLHCIQELRMDHDLVFIEFAVNDFDMNPDYRFAAREGIIRQIREKSKADIIIVYTYFDKMYPYYAQGTLPPTISDFEIIAQHYQLSSVNMGAKAFDMMKRGLMRLDEWLPDGTHPQYRGSVVYAQEVLACIQESLQVVSDKKICEHIYAPIRTQNWSTAAFLAWDEVQLNGPWVLKETSDKWIHEFLYTSSLTASLSFHTHGRVVLLGNLYGPPSAELRFRINNGPWQKIMRYKEDWIQGLSWYRVEVLCSFDEAQDVFVEVQCDHELSDIGSITMIAGVAVIQ